MAEPAPTRLALAFSSRRWAPFLRFGVLTVDGERVSLTDRDDKVRFSCSGPELRVRLSGKSHVRVRGEDGAFFFTPMTPQQAQGRLGSEIIARHSAQIASVGAITGALWGAGARRDETG